MNMYIFTYKHARPESWGNRDKRVIVLAESKMSALAKVAAAEPLDMGDYSVEELDSDTVVCLKDW